MVDPGVRLKSSCAVALRPSTPTSKEMLRRGLRVDRLRVRAIHIVGGDSGAGHGVAGSGTPPNHVGSSTVLSPTVVPTGTIPWG